MKVEEMSTVANDYASIKAALNRGVPLRAEVPRSRALADIDELAKKVLGPAESAPEGTNGKPPSWFGRLKRVLAGATS
jgi:Flp pilus assembly CpaE family ATPase